ncbi:MAG: GNAT family protein [Rhodovibrionaceae bacterium]
MQKASPLRLETPRFVLRTLGAEDPPEPFQKWAADPAIMAPLNLPTRELTAEQVRAYFASFDGRRKFLFGLFSRTSGQQFGFWIVEVNALHATGNWHLAIGERDYWGRGAPLEIGIALLDWLFETQGLEKLSATVPANNPRVRRFYEAVGWPLEGVLRGELKAMNGEGRIDECRYGLLRADWPEVRRRALGHLPQAARGSRSSA